MIHPSIRHIIVGKYQGKRSSQWQPTVTTSRVWQKLTPELLVDLLADTSARAGFAAEGPSTQYLAGQLLRDMRRTDWVIRAGPHEGGKHGSTSEDENLHITVKVGSTSYHLRCKEQPTLHIIQITDGPPTA